MKINHIESFIVRAPIDSNKVYWGAGYWMSDPKQHPGLPEGHPGDITTEYPPIWRRRWRSSTTSYERLAAQHGRRA